MALTQAFNSSPPYSPNEHISAYEQRRQSDSTTISASSLHTPEAKHNEPDNVGIGCVTRNEQFQTCNDPFEADTIDVNFQFNPALGHLDYDGWEVHKLKSGAILATPTKELIMDHAKMTTKVCKDSAVVQSFDDRYKITVSLPAYDIKLARQPVLSTPPHFLQKEVDDFLGSLGIELYKHILQNLCPDNMRGSYCRTPEDCITRDRFFACPDYAVRKRCKHDSVDRFSHFGHKHTLNGCMAKDSQECRKWSRQLGPCRAEVVYFHIRASCVTLRGGSHCQANPCQFGHDYPEIRKAVMGR